ncbi:MAG: hypothetical protein J5760_05935 [Clostridia bacterium]|nr:hypothetical protein [Clostridia bacterium]
MQNVQKTVKKKSYIGRLISNSLLVTVLTYFSEKFRSAASGSFGARIFNCSEKADESAKGSIMTVAIHDAAGSSTVGFVRHGFAAGVESSATVKLYRRFCAAISTASVRSAGVFLLSASLYSALACAVHILRDSAPAKLYNDIIFIVLAVIASAFMLISKKSLGAKFCESAFLSFIFFDTLAIDRMSIKTEGTPVNRFALAFFGGMIFGVASYFVSTVTAIMYLAAAVLALLILYSPESGLLASVFFISVTDSGIIYCVLVVTLVSYFLKLLRGKRNLTLKSEDIFALFAAIVFASAYPGAGVSRTVLVVCVYFMASNLLRTPQLLRKTAVCVSLGLGFNMLLIAAERIMGLFDYSVSELTNGVFTSFGVHDPMLTVLSVLWVLCVMNGRSYRMPSTLKVLFFTAAFFNVVFSASEAVMIAVLIGVFIYAAFRSGRMLNVIFAYILVIPTVWLARYVVSGHITLETMRIPEIRLSGVPVQQILFGGFSCGDNLFASLLGAFGAMGCLLIASMLFMLLVRANSSANAKNEGMRQFCAAAVASITVTFFMGLFADTLADLRGILLFWTFCGMISATGNAIRRSGGSDEY